MPGCAAVGCLSSHRKGFSMKVFPKDPERRAVWIANMNRAGWTPTSGSRLCELHFDSESWEQNRLDGPKLKFNAIPTLFSVPSNETKPVLPDPLQMLDVPWPSTSKKNDIINVKLEETSVSNSTDHPSDVVCADKRKKSKSRTFLKVEEHRSGGSSDEDMGSSSGSYVANKTKMPAVKKLKRQLKRSRESNRRLKLTVRALKKSQTSLINRHNKSALHLVFNEDQINSLHRKSNKWMKWSTETVKQALLLKFSCGSAGYEQIRSHKYPLPSLRSLSYRLSNLEFAPGILTEVVEYFKIKVAQFKSEEKDCSLLIEEMSISPGLVYDATTSSYLGHVTLPGHIGDANNALVFMLGGISTRWKQTIAYFFTEDIIEPSTLKQIVLDIIKLSEEMGLRICSISSDISLSYQTLWKEFNISVDSCDIVNSFKNPIDERRCIYFFVYVPHVVKNISNTLICNKTIVISDDIQTKFNLPTNTINFAHIEELVLHQSKLPFKIANKLSLSDLNPSDDMMASHVLSHNVCSGLRYLSGKLNRPEFESTAWFVGLIVKWCDLMTSRHPVLALSKLKEDVYLDTITFLISVIDIMRSIKIDACPQWRLITNGVILSTKSILDIRKVFLDIKKYTFLLTSRFTLDCLSNLLCDIQENLPDVCQLRNNLKNICISQLIKNVSKGSYHEDDKEFLSEFFRIIAKRPQPPPKNVALPPNTILEHVLLSSMDTD